MANKDRQKRSARKARAAERVELEEKRAAAAPAETKKAVKKVEAAKKAPAKKEPKKTHWWNRLGAWMKEVKLEMHRVTWPSKSELKNYSIAVIVMLIVFGVAVWLVDTGVVALLVSYSGLRG